MPGRESCDFSTQPTSSATHEGEPVIHNCLSPFSIHHRAFDQDLVGIAPDLRVHVSQRLLDDEDGPMLELLKGFHGTTIGVSAK